MAHAFYLACRTAAACGKAVRVQITLGEAPKRRWVVPGPLMEEAEIESVGSGRDQKEESC